MKKLFKQYMEWRSDLRYMWTVGIIIALMLLLGKIFGN
jgi:hypothetical protein